MNPTWYVITMSGVADVRNELTFGVFSYVDVSAGWGSPSFGLAVIDNAVSLQVLHDLQEQWEEL